MSVVQNSVELEQVDLQRRLDEWRTRIDSLYDQIENWLGEDADFICSRRSAKSHKEELSKKLKLRQPTLNELRIVGNGVSAVVRPVGLWVIGANGRLDFIVNNETRIIVDVAESFGAPRWLIGTKDPGKLVPLNRETFFDAIRQGVEELR